MPSTKEPRTWLAIIPASERDAISVKGPAKAIFGDPSGELFQVELVPVTGPDDAPVTHYWAAGQTTNGKYHGFNGLVHAHPGTIFLEYDISDRDFQWETLTTQGLKERRT